MIRPVQLQDRVLLLGTERGIEPPLSVPLTATEIEQAWKGLSKRYPEDARRFERVQAAFLGPLIERAKRLLYSRQGGVGEGGWRRQ